jgi:hypothetical protein
MTEALVATVAAAGLNGPPTPIPRAELERFGWSSLLATCGHHRLIGLLEHLAVERVLPLEEAEWTELAARGQVEACIALDREAVAVEVHETLYQARIEHRFLKGLTFAHRWYPDPAWRSFADVDVLVEGTSLPAVIDALGASGFARTVEAIRGRFDARFGKGVTLRRAGIEVDLHRTLAPGPFGLRICVKDLFADEARVTVGGRSLPALTLEHSFVHACLHATLTHPRRLVPIRDVAQLALAAPHLAALDEIVSRWRASAVVREAVRMARSELGVGLGEVDDYARELSVPARDQSLLTRQRRGGTFAELAWWTLRELPWRDRVAYGTALLMPSANHRRSRGLTRRDLIGREVRALQNLGRHRR